MPPTDGCGAGIFGCLKRWLSNGYKRSSIKHQASVSCSAYTGLYVCIYPCRYNGRNKRNTADTNAHIIMYTTRTCTLGRWGICIYTAHTAPCVCPCAWVPSFLLDHYWSSFLLLARGSVIRHVRLTVLRWDRPTPFPAGHPPDTHRTPIGHPSDTHLAPIWHPSDTHLTPI